MGTLMYPKLLLLSSALALSYLISLAFYRLFLHPLAKFPGPRLAAITRYYEAYYDLWKGGMYIFKIKEMHDKYGPIVRISPYELHINDHDFYEKLYGHDGRFNKDEFAVKPLNAPFSAHGTTDHNLHRIRRASLNPFFSKKKIVSLEPVLQGQVEKLSRRMEEFADSGKVMPLGYAYAAFTMDIVTEYAMEKSYGNLDHEDFNADLCDCVKGVGPIWHLGKHIPWFNQIYAMTPSWVIQKLLPKSGHWKAFQDDCIVQIMKVMSAAESGAINEKFHQTVFREILKSDVLPAQEKTVECLRDQVQSIVSAGTETTAHTLRVITVHLCLNRPILQRLRAEIRTLQPDPYTPAKLLQLEKLPYLTATCLEGLRLSSGVSARLPRISPDQIIRYGDWEIMPGTPVGMTRIFMHEDETIFPDPAAFKPERWMVDAAERRRLERYLLPFSKGARNCVGIHLAWAELYLCLAAVVSRFDLELQGTTVEDVEFGSDQLIPETKGKNGVSVLVKRVQDWD
ncbi:hypothetical protein EPUS_05412 [Endocarpon pusillum Z07020]|uniref:Trichodiene oxygenase n=1 Tax=Endocarpon pusillum (strain Z07020 / HMAS-L-300199) TaxID=1263415 RepID=U1HI50_ENDPU|nr:uncharacterized protein EPUS_05412 [Endocarpon pusillum Z07020]ERF69870.1 hypothetical protein EPUS_05412 [Endocarpon pusillum Z07020]